MKSRPLFCRNRSVRRVGLPSVIVMAALLTGCGVQVPEVPASLAGLPSLDEIILHPNVGISVTPEAFGFTYEEVVLPVAEGRSIVVWHVFAEQPRALVLIMPGSDSNKGRYSAALPLLVPRGYEVVLMDYEGYGNSPGQASLSNILDDAMAATSYALSLNPNTVIIAASLGTPPAVRAAAEFDLKGLILEGTLVLENQASLWLADNADPAFGGIADFWVQQQAPDGWMILKHITQVEEPKLIMHSPEDEVTPYEGGLRVFNAAPEPKEFWEMRGGHGEMIRLDPVAYAEKITGFVESAIAAP